MAKSYVDWAKQESRIKERESIQRYLFENPEIKPYLRQPEDKWALAFLGGEQSGEEAIEWYEVFEPLGFKPEHIVCLENDWETYLRLKVHFERERLPIELHFIDEITFLQTAKQNGYTFDVISLDYTGPINDERMYAIELIVGDGLLGDFGVLVTNFLAKREQKKVSNFINDTRRIKKYIHERGYNNVQKLSIEELLEESKDITTTLKDSRSEVITGVLLDTLDRGESILDYSWILPFREQGYNEQLRTANRHIEGSSLYPFGRTLEEKIARNRAILLQHDRNFEAFLDQGKFHPILRKILFTTLCAPYFPIEAEKYSYTSNSGAPMLFDIIFVNQLRHIFQRFKSYFTINPKLNQIKILSHMLERKRTRLLDKAISTFNSIYYREGEPKIEIFQEQERIFLGSSASNKKTKQKLKTKQTRAKPTNTVTLEDKEKMYDLFFTDMTSAQVAVKLDSKYTEYQVRGVKAEMTRLLNE
ncbi:hypothetical protein CL622_03885 [archaeon]|nr:hypothetical protein [archaeon]